MNKQITTHHNTYIINSIAQTIITFVLIAYPMLVLLLHHVIGIAFAILVFISTLLLWNNHRQHNIIIWNEPIILFIVAMVSPVVAIVLSQIYHLSFSINSYDEASRFLLAIPIVLAFRLQQINSTNILRYSMPLGAILAFIAFGLKFVILYHDPEIRLETDFLNAIHFGDLALMLGMLSLFVAARHNINVILLSLQILGCCSGVALSIFSGSRGGWLALPFLLFIWARLYFDKPNWMQIIVFSLSIIVICIALYFTSGQVQTRIGEIFSDLHAFFVTHVNVDTPVGIRLNIWRSALSLFFNQPIFGLGPDGYIQEMRNLGNARLLSAETLKMGIAEVHQQFLSYAVKYGIFGLLAMLAVHFIPLSIFINLARKSSHQVLPAIKLGICLIIGFFIFGLTVEIFNLKMTVTFFSLTLSILLGEALAYKSVISNEQS